MIRSEDVRAARDRHHVTQAQLAHECGVSIRTAARWESGESRVGAEFIIWLKDRGEGISRSPRKEQIFAELRAMRRRIDALEALIEADHEADAVEGAAARGDAGVP